METSRYTSLDFTAIDFETANPARVRDRQIRTLRNTARHRPRGAEHRSRRRRTAPDRTCAHSRVPCRAAPPPACAGAIMPVDPASAAVTITEQKADDPE